MRLRLVPLTLLAALIVALAGCGGTSEPTEAQMKEGMQNYFDAPLPGVTNPAPIKITSFQKQACDKPTPQGYKCTLTVTVESANMLAQMYNNLPFGVFYKDKDTGKWMMRPPF